MSTENKWSRLALSGICRAIPEALPDALASRVLHVPLLHSRQSLSPSTRTVPSLMCSLFQSALLRSGLECVSPVYPQAQVQTEHTCLLTG